jgi:putative transposase
MTSMERCFGTIKTERVHQSCSTLGAAQLDTFAYTEGHYNRRRVHSASTSSFPNQQSAKLSNPSQ